MCYVAYARIKYWNAVTETVDTENIALTQIQSFTEAMKRIKIFMKMTLFIANYFSAKIILSS